MKNNHMRKSWFPLVFWLVIVAVALALSQSLQKPLLASGLTIPHLVALVAGIIVFFELLTLLSALILVRRGRPAIEGTMLGRIYRLAAVVAVVLAGAYGFGQAKSFGQFFALFGGMILGWSLQAPVSGFAAWILVSIKRPFRPGDRIQFPNLGLTGDVHDIGPMYTMLDQVGGTIGSEEAVGRYILVPNPLLFSQVVINYTVLQESPYMLDEIIIRITFDSNWQRAESILLAAAREITGDIIQATGVDPYIRADPYDYGIYLRLRYQCRVKDRAEIQYELTKRIFGDLQGDRSVDLAIPYVYSYRSGADQKDAGPRDKDTSNIHDIEIALVHNPKPPESPEVIGELSASIAERGLLQPIVVLRRFADGQYEIVAGNARYEACKALGWKTIPAIVRDPTSGDATNTI
jgi:small-conductance mechanosensitive channel